MERHSGDDDVSSLANGSGPDRDAAVFLIPSSLRTGEIARVLREGYDVARLNDGLGELQRALGLDDLVIDTHPGVNEETVLSIAISDALVIVLRADRQDYQGTAVTVDLAQRLEMPRTVLVVNKVLPPYDAAVAGVLPLSEDMDRLASSGVFALVHPDHAITGVLRAVAAQIQ
jgi:septum site-determining protein MinD